MFKACVIGCGRIGCGFDDDIKRKYISTHAGAYTNSSTIKLVGICDVDKVKVDTYSRKFKTKGYTDYIEMVKSEKPDIVSICTNPDSHLKIIRNIAALGIKAIFCEKPISENLIDASEIINLCKINNIILQVNHQRRFDPLHIEIKDYINNGKLGTIQTVNFYYTSGILNTGTHMFDLLDYFFGDVEWIFSTYSNNKPVKDINLDGCIKFKSGLFGSIHACLSSPLLFELDIIGTKGRIILKDSGYTADFYDVTESLIFSGYESFNKSKSPFTNNDKNFIVDGVNNLIDCINNNKESVSNGITAMKALDLILKFKKSAESGGIKI